MAVAAKTVTAAPNVVVPKRKGLTKGQRTAKSKGYQRRKTLELAGRISKENIQEVGRQRRITEQTRTRESQVRIHQREEAILHRYREGIGIRRTERLQRQLVEEPVVRTTQPVTNSIVVVLVVMMLLIILYQIVTRAEQFSGFLNRTGSVLSAFTQTGPLFTKTGGT